MARKTEEEQLASLSTLALSQISPPPQKKNIVKLYFLTTYYTLFSQVFLNSVYRRHTTINLSILITAARPKFAVLKSRSRNVFSAAQYYPARAK